MYPPPGVLMKYLSMTSAFSRTTPDGPKVNSHQASNAGPKQPSTSTNMIHRLIRNVPVCMGKNLNLMAAISVPKAQRSRALAGR